MYSIRLVQPSSSLPSGRRLMVTPTEATTEAATTGVNNGSVVYGTYRWTLQFWNVKASNASKSHESNEKSMVWAPKSHDNPMVWAEVPYPNLMEIHCKSNGLSWFIIPKSLKPIENAMVWADVPKPPSQVFGWEGSNELQKRQFMNSWRSLLTRESVHVRTWENRDKTFGKDPHAGDNLKLQICDVQSQLPAYALQGRKFIYCASVKRLELSPLSNVSNINIRFK